MAARREMRFCFKLKYDRGDSFPFYFVNPMEFRCVPYQKENRSEYDRNDSFPFYFINPMENQYDRSDSFPFFLSIQWNVVVFLIKRKTGKIHEFAPYLQVTRKFVTA